MALEKNHQFEGNFFKLIVVVALARAVERCKSMFKCDWKNILMLQIVMDASAIIHATSPSCLCIIYAAEKFLMMIDLTGHKFQRRAAVQTTGKPSATGEAAGALQENYRC